MKNVTSIQSTLKCLTVTLHLDIVKVLQLAMSYLSLMSVSIFQVPVNQGFSQEIKYCIVAILQKILRDEFPMASTASTSSYKSTCLDYAVARAYSYDTDTLPFQHGATTDSTTAPVRQLNAK